MAVDLARFSGAVLAGGTSTRMGRDKALIDLGDRRLVQVAVDALTAAGATEVFVVGGDMTALEALGLLVVPDEFPGEGPLGGVITALDHAAEAIVAVLACDHTSTEAPAVRSIVGALGEGDVVVPVVEGRRQTMHAAWRREVRTHLRTRFESGARSLREGLAGLDVVALLDGDPCWFHDADVSSDLPPPRQ
jgi:molybdopterin-guanine dinucleotide biosynthesis protein A